MANKQLILYVGVFIFLLGVWFLRWQMTKPSLPKTPALVRFQDTLLSEPKIIGQSAYFMIQHIRIRTSIYPAFNYGDRLEIEGELKSNLIMDFPKITKISEEKKGLGNNIFKVRKYFLDLVARSLPEPHASLLAGILLGKASLDRGFEADLKKTGTIHTVVVSGFNITVVAGFVLTLAGLLKRRFVLVLTFLTIVFYVLLTGANPPAIRAAIMGGLAFFALAVGRQRDSLWILILAAAAMLIWQPNWISDLSFGLSFLATLGIILLSKPLESLLEKTNFLKGDLATTIAAQSFVTPLIFYNFGTISLLSPIVNALILWAIPPITILGFVFLLVASIIFPAGQVISWFIWLLLSYFIFVVQAFSKLSFTSFEFGRSSLILVIVYYLLLFWIVIKFKDK